MKRGKEKSFLFLHCTNMRASSGCLAPFPLTVVTVLSLFLSCSATPPSLPFSLLKAATPKLWGHSRQMVIFVPLCMQKKKQTGRERRGKEGGKRDRGGYPSTMGQRDAERRREGRDSRCKSGCSHARTHTHTNNTYLARSDDDDDRGTRRNKAISGEEKLEGHWTPDARRHQTRVFGEGERKVRSFQ